jgi:hypothetical protein
MFHNSKAAPQRRHESVEAFEHLLCRNSVIVKYILPDRTLATELEGKEQ